MEVKPLYDSKRIAENATMQSFLNCYLRETGNYECTDVFDSFSQHVFISKLSIQKIDLVLPLEYWSLTDRHLFSFPIYYRVQGEGDLQPLDYVTLVTLIVKEFLLDQQCKEAEDELIYRVILSCRSIRNYVEGRLEDGESLSRSDVDFIEAEQSLLFGHLLHPTPKSKQGLTEEEDRLYSPERKGEFQLHYFAADEDLVVHDSSRPETAVSIIINELKDGGVDEEWIDQLVNEKGKVLIPVHPLQTKELLSRPEVQERIMGGNLEYIGPLGRVYTATSSLRSVYAKQSPYMFKFSVPVKITNSLRINQAKELARGVEVSKLLQTDLGKALKGHFPDFNIIEDPAYINLESSEDISGFEVVIRDNPFREAAGSTSLIAGLCQDHPYGGKPRIHSIITEIAVREGRTVEQVSEDWLSRYLSISLDPMMWLFSHYGIALEAHQQNSLVTLKEGYPHRFHYRDNQGYYYSRSKAGKLAILHPGISAISDTTCDDDVAEERFRYYFFFNHLFGLINGFGVSGLIEEENLIRILRTALKKHEGSMSGGLVESLLYQPVLPCKANLLTRFYDMDELIGPMESQSVYTMVRNPIAHEVEVRHGV